MTDSNCYVINFSVDTSGTKPVVTITPPGASPPDVSHSISVMIDNIIATVQKGTENIQANLTTLSQELTASVAAFQSEYSADITAEYNQIMTEIQSATLSYNPSALSIKHTSQTNHSKLIKLLVNLKTRYEKNMINVPMRNSRRVANGTNFLTTSTNIDRKAKFISLTDLESESSTNSSQLEVLFQNDTNIAKALSDIASKLTSKQRFVANKTVFNPTSLTNSTSKKIPVISKSQLELSISKFRTELQSKNITLPQYAMTALSQIETHVETSDINSLNSLFNLVKSSLSDADKTSLSETLNEIQANIATAITNFLNSSSSRTARRRTNASKNVPADTNTNEVINTMIAALTKKRNDASAAYADKLKNGTIDQNSIDEFTANLTKLNGEIANLESQRTNNGILFGNTDRGIPKAMKQLGTTIGQSAVGTYIKFFVDSTKVPKSLTHDEQQQINNDISNLTITKPISHEAGTKVRGLLSYLNVNTTVYNGEVTVNYNITINDEQSSGSFLLNVDALNFISYQMLTSTNKLDKAMRAKIAQEYGITVNSSDAKVELWNSYLVYIYSYLSLISFCMLNKSNSLNITIPDDLSSNMISFLRMKMICKISGVTVPMSTLTSDNDVRNITKLASAGLWPYYFYSSQYPEIFGDSSAAQTLSNSLNSLVNG